MSESKTDPTQEIAAAVEKIGVAVDDTKAVVAAAGVVAGEPPPDDHLREYVQAILEQVGAAKWSLDDALEKLTKLRDSLGAHEKL